MKGFSSEGLEPTQDSSTNKSFDSGTDALYAHFSEPETTSTNTNSNSGSINVGRFNLIDIEINNIRDKIHSLETENRDLQKYHKTTETLNKGLLGIIVLVPVMFTITTYLALKDYIPTLPVWCSTLIGLGLSALTLLEIFKVALYIPFELKEMKRKIENLENQKH
jgi:hypothetical protein